MEYIEKTLTGIITHGTNSITFTDDFITNESIIDVYFSSDDIVPTDQEQIGNRLIVSIEPQTYDVSIAIHITNDDTINYSEELESLSDTVGEHTTAISDLASDIDNLNASTISYDEHSTLYSAMGDIDSLETESKNLVGAINENFTYVSSGKTLIANAITDKGVTTLASDTFETMAHNIGEIETGGGGSLSPLILLNQQKNEGTSTTPLTFKWVSTYTGRIYIIQTGMASGGGISLTVDNDRPIVSSSQYSWSANWNIKHRLHIIDIQVGDTVTATFTKSSGNNRAEILIFKMEG